MPRKGYKATDAHRKKLSEIKYLEKYGGNIG